MKFYVKKILLLKFISNQLYFKTRIAKNEFEFSNVYIKNSIQTQKLSKKKKFHFKNQSKNIKYKLRKSFKLKLKNYSLKISIFYKLLDKL